MNNNKNFQYVIGIDGGGTKTIAAIADLSGKILGKSKSGSSNPRNVGIKRAVFNIAKAIKPFTRDRKRKVVSTAIALPAVEEEYRGKKKEILKLLRDQKEISKIFQGKVKIFSDQLSAFRAGTCEETGVSLISGTGCVAHGWKGEKEIKAAGWGWISDEGSGFWIGHRVVQAILKDLDGRGEKTLLTGLAVRKFKIKDMNNFLRKVYLNPAETIPQFSILCSKASKKRDRVAKRIMVEAGNELALSANTVIIRLNFQKIKFPLVLVGSVFQNKIVFTEVKTIIKKIAPKVQFILLNKEPVVGAVKLARESIR